MQSNHEDQKQADDSLNLSQQPHIMSKLNQKQQVKYSILIKKINEDRMIQERIFLLTNEAIYNISKNSSLIKSLVGRLITLQSKYTVKRRISIKSIYGITLSKSRQNGQFVLHVNDDYDYRYCAQNHEKKVIILKKICQVHTIVTGKKLRFYFKDEIVLIDYTTRKCDLKNKINPKPKQDPIYLNQQDFQQYELPDLNYKLQYCSPFLTCQTSQVSMKSFKPIFEIEKLQNNVKYYTVTTGKLSLKESLELMKFNSKYLLQPEFIFSTKNKLQLITPFTIGGNLARKLQTCVRISDQLAYFYIAQLILILEDFTQRDIFHANFCLQNVLINQNGYLRVIGIDKDVRKLQKNQTIYEISGYLPYIAPEMIFVKGYTHDVNLWKLGICAHRLLIGSFPFQGDTTKKVYFEILNKKLKHEVPQFLHSLLQKDPTKRTTLQQLKKKIKFSQIQWQKLREQIIPAPYQPDTSSWKGNLPSIVQLRTIN